MASITIRDIPNEAKETLRVQAAQAGLSLEAYARHILQTTARAPGSKSDNILQLAEKYFGKNHGIAIDLPSRKSRRGAAEVDA